MRIRKAIYFILASIAMAYSCTGLKEQEAPMIYSVTSLIVKPVDVTEESLEFDFVADLECGSKVSGESSFIYSQNQNFSSSSTVEADEAFTAKTLLNGYGETYYVKAVFSNGRNKIESEAVSFELLSFDEYVSISSPELSSESESKLSVYSNVEFADGIVPDKFGFELSKSLNPFKAESSVSALNKYGLIEGEFSSLEPGCSYYVRAFLKENTLVAYSDVTALSTKAVIPSLTLPVVSEIDYDRATLSGELLSDGGAPISEQGFVFGQEKDPTLGKAQKVVTDQLGKGKYSLIVEGLDPGKVYYVKSFATNSKGTAYSLESSFTTGLTLSTVTTTAVSSITSSSAKSGGAVTSDGGSAVTARGVVWAETSMPTIASDKTTNGSGLGSFTSSMSGLKPGTKYYVRAYATTVAGTAYGNEMTFTTDIALPVVVTANITDITYNSANGGGSITSDGGSEITAKGIVWSTSQNPTVSLATKTTEGTGVSAFTSQITGLTPGATYYVRAYATNAKGTAYGAQVTFKTSTVVPTVSTSLVSSITSSSALCGGNVINDGGAPVTARGVVWSTSHTPTVSLSTKTSNGTGIGTFSSTISGLEPGKTYYIRAYATNLYGTSYGEERSFLTIWCESIDLGLSVKWATCNLGAVAPEEYGGYYQWAGTQDVTDKIFYLDSNNCPYHGGSNDITGWTKYVPEGYIYSSYWSGSGSPDNKIVLDLIDDAAHVVLGDNWRMPSIAEFAELRNTSNCSWTWTAINGIYGYKVQSKKSGFASNWIFFPMGGFRHFDYHDSVGFCGSYWSSSLDTEFPGGAYHLELSSDDVGVLSGHRYYGLSVRPVTE